MEKFCVILVILTVTFMIFSYVEDCKHPESEGINDTLVVDSTWQNIDLERDLLCLADDI